MQEITATYWMIIIGFLTFFFCLVLLYIVLLLKESKDAIKESKEILQASKESVLKVGRIVDTLENTVNYAKATVEEVSNRVLMPFNAIGGLVDRVVGSVENKLSRSDIPREQSSIEDILSE